MSNNWKKKGIVRMWGRKFQTASVRKPRGLNGPERKCAKKKNF
jgi:hypothetical protein